MVSLLERRPVPGGVTSLQQHEVMRDARFEHLASLCDGVLIVSAVSSPKKKEDTLFLGPSSTVALLTVLSPFKRHMEGTNVETQKGDSTTSPLSSCATNVECVKNGEFL